jgi:hypothetical protein
MPRVGRVRMVVCFWCFWCVFKINLIPAHRQAFRQTALVRPRRGESPCAIYPSPIGRDRDSMAAAAEPSLFDRTRVGACGHSPRPAKCTSMPSRGAAHHPVRVASPSECVHFAVGVFMSCLTRPDSPDLDLLWSCTRTTKSQAIATLATFLGLNYAVEGLSVPRAHRDLMMRNSTLSVSPATVAMLLMCCMRPPGYATALSLRSRRRFRPALGAFCSILSRIRLAMAE